MIKRDHDPATPESHARGEGPYTNDGPISWILRGVVVGILMLGAANALSFFFRSEGWGSLLGDLEPYDEAIGFPFAVWNEASSYGEHPLNKSAFAMNIFLGVIAGSLVGWFAARNRVTMNAIMNRLAGSHQNQIKMQFSLRGLMITTVVAALSAALVRYFTPRVEFLAGVYALGPIALVAIAFVPRGLSWQQRVTIITPATIVLIAITITLGQVLDVPFDKVLLGVFICWTPQTAIAAVALSAWVMFREYRSMRAEQVSS